MARRLLSISDALGEILGQNDQIIALLQTLVKQESQAMSLIDDVKTKYEHLQTVQQSTLALVKTLSVELKDAIANGDQGKLQALADMMDSDAQTLADAVTANTPAQDGSTTGGSGASPSDPGSTTGSGDQSTGGSDQPTGGGTDSSVGGGTGDSTGGGTTTTV